MIASSSLRAGMAIRFEDRTYRVLQAEYHAGQGRMTGSTHARLKDVDTGTTWEHSFRADLKLEELPVERRPLTYLYKDGDLEWFMDPQSFEQLAIPDAVIGDVARFLRPDIQLSAEFVLDR